MKNFNFGILILVTAFCACQPQEDYKQKREEVMKYHDTVMADAGNVVDKQMKISEMLKNMKALKSKNPQIDTLVEKDSLTALHTRLEQADSAMNDWMHKFEPDASGKSNAEAVKYFESEKLTISRVDTLFKKEIKSADTYLNKFKY